MHDLNSNQITVQNPSPPAPLPSPLKRGEGSIAKTCGQTLHLTPYTLLLTSRAKERAALCLDNALDGFLFASQAWFVFAIVNLVKILIVSFAVDRAAVSAIAQCRPLLFDGFAEDSDRFLVNAFPMRFFDCVATRSRKDLGRVKDFRCV